jgi:PD-(D/E)XK endonuclease
MTTDQKGAIAETAIALAAIKLGIGVFRPYGDERYDLILDCRPRLWRVQCKWARRYGDVVIVRCYSSRRARSGLLRRKYTADEIDAFAAYCQELDRCFFLPIEDCPQNEVRLRIGPTKNNQKLGVTWADDFDFAATLGRYQGAIAQLGERRLGMAEVAGSSPAGSTLSQNST